MSDPAGNGAYRAAIAAAILVAVAAGADLETTVGTVQKVNPSAREVTVVTGRGYALRAIVFHLDPAAEPAPELEAGMIVEIRHRKVGGREVASRVTIVPPQRGQP